MRRFEAGRGALLLFLGVMACGAAGCGYNTPGKMEWVQAYTSGTPRVGTVYLVRGWKGVFSIGIDQMAEQLQAQGVTARVYMPEQFPEMAKAMVAEYRGKPDHEPIVLIGHSRGVDAAIFVSRELAKAGVSVDLMVCLDSVDERVVPGNVKVCQNFWMPGFFYGTNLLRGIPLEKEAGSTGKLYNYKMDTDEGAAWHEPLMNHVDMDKGPKLQKHIVELCLEVCVERAKWKGGRPAAGSGRTGGGRAGGGGVSTSTPW